MVPPRRRIFAESAGRPWPLEPRNDPVPVRKNTRQLAPLAVQDVDVVLIVVCLVDDRLAVPEAIGVPVAAGIVLGCRTPLEECLIRGDFLIRFGIIYAICGGKKVFHEESRCDEGIGIVPRVRGAIPSDLRYL